jgi:hypothetical protein
MQQVNMRDRSGRVLTTLLVHPDRLPVVAPIIAGRYDLRGISGIRRVLDLGAAEGAFANWIWAVTGGCWVDCWEPDETLATLCASQLPPGGRMLHQYEIWDVSYERTIISMRDELEHTYDIVRLCVDEPHWRGEMATIVDYQVRGC